MLNQEIKPFTLNVSIRICQTINLKIVATQAVSHHIRISSVLAKIDFIYHRPQPLAGVF